MTQARLILIKHAQPQIDPDVPSALWVLGEEGRGEEEEAGGTVEWSGRPSGCCRVWKS